MARVMRSHKKTSRANGLTVRLPVMRTVGPLARSAHMNSRGLVGLAPCPGPPLRCSPGYGNARAVGPFARRELVADRRALVGDVVIRLHQ
jgi:hypothetical protein